MVVVLLGITAVTSSAVGVVYRLTEAPIARAKQLKKTDALAQVLPAFDNAPADEMALVATENGEFPVYPARMGETTVGYAVESVAAGFGGPIRIMVGFEPDGNIRNIRVLEQTETPGLGAKLAEEGNPVQASLSGRKPSEMKLAVRKDGGEVDAITASTISSRAYVLAVSRAYTAFLEASGADASGWDASSGATSSQRAATSADTDSASGATVQTEGNASGQDASSGATSSQRAAASADTDSASGATVQTEGNASGQDASSGATSSQRAAASADTDSASGATVQTDEESSSRRERGVRGRKRPMAGRRLRATPAAAETDTAASRDAVSTRVDDAVSGATPADDNREKGGMR